MKGWLRRLRGTLGIGAVWATAGMALGTVGGITVSLIEGLGGLPLLGSIAEFALGAGALGFMLGGGFATVLSVFERRRTLEELSSRRAAIWGAAAGAALPALWSLLFLLPGVTPVVSSGRLAVALLAGCATYGALTGALAAGTVALAKRAPPELDSGGISDDGVLSSGPRDS